MTNQQINALAESIVFKLDDFGRGVNIREYGLPIYDDDDFQKMKSIVAKEILFELKQKNDRTGN